MITTDGPKVRVNDAETLILQGLAEQVPENGLIVEIGSAWGHSCVAMAEASRDTVTIITIDPWSLIEKDEWAAREKRFLKNIKPFGDRIEVIKAFSQEVNVKELLGNRKIDMLFIDGDHHLNAVRDDYLNYHKFIKPGGVIAFHDYGLLAGVIKAVDRFVVPSGLWDFHTEQRLWIGRLK